MQQNSDDVGDTEAVVVIDAEAVIDIEGVAVIESLGVTEAVGEGEEVEDAVAVGVPQQETKPLDSAGGGG